MSSWGDLNAGFDSDEETANFGARHVVEAQHGSFECITVAAFGESGQGEEEKEGFEPFLHAISSLDKICVAVDKSLSIFDNAEKKSKICNLTFDTPVECLALSQDSKYLFACNLNGNFSIFCTATMQALYMCTLTDKENKGPYFLQILLKPQSADTVDVFVVCKDGTIYCLDNINLATLANNSSSTIQKEQHNEQNGSLVKEFKALCPMTVHSAVLHGEQGCARLLIAGDKLALCDLSDGLSVEAAFDLVDASDHILKLQSSENTSLVYALQANGRVWTLCPYSLMYLSLINLDCEANDFILMEDMIGNKTQLMTSFTSESDSNHKSDLNLYNVLSAGLECVYNIQLDAIATIVPTTTLVEDTLFLEKKFEGRSVVKVLLKTVAKSQPEFRLQRFLRQRKFKEAIDFATLHNLDLQIVYKEEAKSFVEHLSPWSSDMQETEVPDENACVGVPQLTKLLDKITDVEFVVQCCFNAIAPDILQTRVLLTYARNRISEQPKMHCDLHKSVCQLIQRLDTFEGISKNLDPDEWISFSQANLLQFCCNLLEMNELGSATEIWVRHEAELLNLMPSNDIIPTLNLIPTTTKLKTLLAWLNAFVPSVLFKMPDKLSDIIIWLNNKILMLEFEYPELWPNIALNFCDRVMQILQPPKSEGVSEWIMHLHQQHSNNYSPLQDLKRIRSVLYELHDLKTNYFIKLTMADYTQEDKSKVAHLILSMASSSKLELLVNNVLGQFIHENNLDIEEVISSYIDATTNYKDWWCWEMVPFEAEILTLISLLKNTERVLSCTLAVLKAAPVPWSKNLLDLVKCYEGGTHPLVAEIKSERKFLQAKLILKKYNICVKLSCLAEEEFQVLRVARAIFMEGRPEMLNDALQIVHQTPDLKESVLSLYLEHLLNNGDFKAAHKHLSSFEPAVCVKICEKILTKVEAMMTFSLDLQESGIFIAFLDPALACLEKAVKLLNCNKNNLVKDFESKSKCLEDYFVLKIKLKVGNAELFMGHTKQREVYLSYIQDCLALPSPENPKILAAAKSVARLLGLHELEASLLLVESLCSADLYVLAADAVRSVEAPGNKCIHKDEVNILSRLTRNVLSHFQKVQNNTCFLPALRDTLCTIMIHCDPCYIEEMLELKADMNMAISVMAHLQQSLSVHETFLPLAVVRADPFQKWTYSPIYEDAPFNTEKSCKSLEKLFGIFFKKDPIIKQEYVHQISFPSDASADNTKALFGWKNEDEEDVGTVMIEQQLKETFDFLLSENNDLLALELVCHLGPKCQVSTTQLEQQAVLLTQCSKVLLKKVLASKQADLPFALILLQTLPKDDSTQFLEHSIKKVRRDCNHLSRLSQVAIDFSRLCKDSEHLARLHKLLLIGTWGKTFKKMSICNKDLMQDDVHTRSGAILCLMIKEKGVNLDMEIVSKFCTDFELPFKDAVILCLENLILSWTPEVTFVKKEDGYEGLAPIDFTAILAKASFYTDAYLKCIDATDLDRRLDVIWDKLNFYHYEMYLCLLGLKAQLNPNTQFVQSSILHFLQPYKRRVAPQVQEIEKWLRFHPHDTGLPAIAQWRLPFPLFMLESKEIIQTEVNLQNYCIWLQAPAALECSNDHICVRAINNSIRSEICMNNYEEWCVQAQDDKLISDIEECANKITDPTVACAVLDYVAKRIPPGLDKLTVTELTYQKVTAWHDDVQSGESNDVFNKVNGRLMLYSTVHCLHNHGLGKPEYLKLAETPTQLVDALYNDPTIVERARGIDEYFPDINSAINQLGPIQNLNLEKIRHNLLESWLLPEMMNTGSLDESFVDTSQVWKQYDQEAYKAKQEAEENMIKACYLIESGDDGQRLKFFDYLVGITFSPKSGCSARIRRRALLCLFWLVPMELLVQLSARDEEYIRNLSPVLFFLSEIENLQGTLAMTVEDFENQNKPSIIESLWQQHSQNPQALVLMCKICVYYKIINPQVWANLLSHMQHLSMIDELKLILPKLNGNAHSLCTKQFISAWNAMLIAPFEKIETPMIEEEKQACIESLILLQACPLRSDMDMKQMFTLCLQSSHFDLAAIIMTLSSISKRPSLLKKLFELTTRDHLKSVLQTLRNFATLPVTQTLEIIEELNPADAHEKCDLKEETTVI